MKSIAGAIVIFSGCLLWASGVFADALVRMHSGNIGASQMATWGGVIVVLAGFVSLLKPTDQSAT